MRQQVFDKLFTAMAVEQDLFSATADMGINLVERFQETYPHRFVNVGIAEQNLIGVGAGLCNTGYRPFLYTISNFLIHRCFEQIRNDLVLHGHPAVLLGTSTGFDNAPLGPTHHVVDDWGCLAGLQEIDIYCPSSASYAAALLSRLVSVTRPAYVRIPKGNFAEPDTTDDFCFLAGDERRFLIITYGPLVQHALAVQQQRRDVSVLITNRLHPLDEAELLPPLKEHEAVITVEDHFPQNGMYAAICRLCGRHQLSRSLYGLGPPHYDLEVGKSAAYYHQKYHTDVDGILSTIFRIENELNSANGTGTLPNPVEWLT